MDDGIQRTDGLGGHRGLIEPSESSERRQASGDIRRGVGVQCRPTTLMPGVERGEHITHLGSAALPQDDAIGPHAQRRAHKRAHGHGPDPLDIVAALLKMEDMRMVRTQLGGLLNAHNALGGAHQTEESGQEGRLSGTGGPGDEAGGPRLNKRRQHRIQAGRDRTRFDELAQGEGAAPFGTQADKRAVGRQGRQNGVEAGAVGQGGIDHGTGVVQPAPAGGGHAHRERARLRLGQGSAAGGLQTAAAIDPGASGADENVGDAVDLQQRLEHRTGALDVGAHAAAQSGQAAGAGGGSRTRSQGALQADPTRQRPAHDGELVLRGASVVDARRGSGGQDLPGAEPTPAGPR